MTRGPGPTPPGPGAGTAPDGGVCMIDVVECEMCWSGERIEGGQCGGYSSPLSAQYIGIYYGGFQGIGPGEILNGYDMLQTALA